MDPQRQPGIQFAQIFLSHAQFTHRDDALTLPTNSLSSELPVGLQIRIIGKPGGEDIALAVRAFTPDDPTLLYKFSVEITAIVSTIAGAENLDPMEYARNMGASALFPFLREAVSNLTLRGRFGPVFLRPFNFQAAELIPVSDSTELAEANG